MDHAAGTAPASAEKVTQPLVRDLIDTLLDVTEYLDQRADADSHPGIEGFIPNEEMKLLTRVTLLLDKLYRLREP